MATPWVDRPAPAQSFEDWAGASGYQMGSGGDYFADTNAGLSINPETLRQTWNSERTKSPEETSWEERYGLPGLEGGDPSFSTNLMSLLQQNKYFGDYSQDQVTQAIRGHSAYGRLGAGSDPYAMMSQIMTQGLGASGDFYDPGQASAWSSRVADQGPEAAGRRAGPEAFGGLGDLGKFAAIAGMMAGGAGLFGAGEAAGMSAADLAAAEGLGAASEAGWATVGGADAAGMAELAAGATMPPAIKPGLPGSGVGPGGFQPVMPAAIPPGQPGSGVGPGGLPAPAGTPGGGVDGGPPVTERGQDFSGTFQTGTAGSDIMSILRSIISPAGGGAVGGPISGILSAGTSLYGLYQSEQMKRMARLMASRSDPWGASGGRAAAAAQLSGVLTGGSDAYTQTPAYKARMQAVERSMAANGYLGSGNMAVAAANAGGAGYNEYLQMMSGLSGAGVNPGGAAQMEMAGNASGNNLAINSLGLLAKTAAMRNW